MEELIVALVSTGFTAGLVLMLHLDRTNTKRTDRFEGRMERLEQNFSEFRVEISHKIEESARLTNGRIDQLDGRIDQLAGRMDGRMDQLAGRMDQLADRLDGRIDQLADRLDGRIDKLDDSVVELVKSVGREEVLVVAE